MFEEDKCENCWWQFGLGGTCANPRYANKLDTEIVKPCGWFKPKLEPPEEPDPYEVYQKVWN